MVQITEPPLNARAAASLLGLHVNTMSAWLRRGRLPEATRGPSGAWQIPPAAVRRLLRDLRYAHAERAVREAAATLGGASSGAAIFAGIDRLRLALAAFDRERAVYEPPARSAA